MTDDNFDIREQRNSKDKEFENALRPLRFEDFSGQSKVVENLCVFVEAARSVASPLTTPFFMVLQGLARQRFPIS